MVSGKVHFTPRAFGKTISAGTRADVRLLWLLPERGVGLSLAWRSARLPFCVADELPRSFCLSPRAVRRVSAGLLWLSCKPSGSPCSVERSPARPHRSGPDRWKGSSRVRVWRHTEAESWSHPGCSGDCCRWTGRTSGGTRGWRWPWWRPLLSSRPPPPTWCFLAPLKKDEDIQFDFKVNFHNSFTMHLLTCCFALTSQPRWLSVGHHRVKSLKKSLTCVLITLTSVQSADLLLSVFMTQSEAYRLVHYSFVPLSQSDIISLSTLL